ncbi:MAG: arylsulfatase B [Pseudohongiellaceae bacterium]|jgi:arylsulfatase B
MHPLLIAIQAMCLALPAPSDPPNILLLISDDQGVDRVGAYGEHPQPGQTPVIDQLAAEGILFRNAWSSPVCSSTRAGILTGRLGFRTGITSALSYGSGTVELSLDEVTIPEVLGSKYATAAVGKWHMAKETLSGLDHPILSGFDHHWGTIDSFVSADGPGIYYDFDKNVDGTSTPSTTYATTDNVDDALTLISKLPEPWFVWLAFNAPHAPYHVPPDELHSYSLSGDPKDSASKHVKASIEAMDTEIGRLLAGLGDGALANTTVIFVGDNGTTTQATSAPFKSAHAKGTVFEGGVNVPLIVAGAGVPVHGRECTALVQTTDLFATIAELGGAPETSAEDSVSLVPYFRWPERPSQRRWAFTELRKPTGPGPYNTVRLAVRGARFKLIFDDATVLAGQSQYEFYDLHHDPFESNDLLPGNLTPYQQLVFDRLKELLDGFM